MKNFFFFFHAAHKTEGERSSRVVAQFTPGHFDPTERTKHLQRGRERNGEKKGEEWREERRGMERRKERKSGKEREEWKEKCGKIKERRENEKEREDR
jgi:hypothetical protein